MTEEVWRIQTYGPWGWLDFGVGGNEVGTRYLYEGLKRDHPEQVWRLTKRTIEVVETSSSTVA